MLERLSPACLVIGPRPGKKSFDRLADLGITHCCTLLSEKEAPQSVEKISARLGCQWLWLPVDGGNLAALKATPMAEHLSLLHSALASTEAPKLYLHCSAGLHRTGYVAYILLRLMGLDERAAFEALKTLRSVTADEVGQERLQLAETFLATQ